VLTGAGTPAGLYRARVFQIIRRGSDEGAFNPFGARPRELTGDVSRDGGELIICLFYVSWPGQARALLSRKSRKPRPGLTTWLHPREHAPRSFETETPSRADAGAILELVNACKACKLAWKGRKKFRKPRVPLRGESLRRGWIFIARR